MRNDYTNYLMHRDHKYIDRKWVRGKWQYIYDEKLGGKEKKAVDRAQRNLDSATNSIHNAYSHPQSDVSEYTNSMTSYANAANEYTNARYAYAKTPLGKCESFINMAKNFLDRFTGNNTKTQPDNSNRPRARKKNTTPSGSGLAKRGSANTGKPVGNGGNVNERFNIRRR